MKITAIDYMKLFVPWKASFKEPMRHWREMSGTTPEEEDAYVVVRVHTDEGRIASPEDIRYWYLGSYMRGATGLLLLRWRPLLDSSLTSTV